MDIKYIFQNYLTMDYSCEFDAIFLIYCDLGALSDTDRAILLKKIHKALKPGGVFVFDVLTIFNWEQHSSCNWYVSDTGFWRPFPHLVLEQTFHYEEENVLLRQYNVIDNDGTIKTYKIWDHYYSRETIMKLMNEHGYQVQDIWSDLTGESYNDGTKSLGVAVRKAD
jgi:SAM-dependent methyltransferase